MAPIDLRPVKSSHVLSRTTSIRGDYAFVFPAMLLQGKSLCVPRVLGLHFAVDNYG